MCGLAWSRPAMFLALLTPTSHAYVGDPPPSAPATQVEAGAPDTKPVPTADLSSPRATMRTFLVAVQAATGDHPERIDEAVACLDVSGLEGEDAAERARGLARRLQAVIDALGVKLEDIPDAPETSDYVFHQADSTEGVSGGPEISLSRDADGERWLFTPQTLTSVPALEAKTKEDVPPAKSADSTVPAARRSPRATMDTFIRAMKSDPPDYDAAILCLNPTGRDPAAWKVAARELAVTLKTVMDKTKVAVLTEIPDTPDGQPYTWHTAKTGNIVLARIAVDAGAKEADPFDLHDGEWRFTPQTLKTIGALYEGLEDTQIVAELKQEGVTERLTVAQWIRRQMPESLRTDVWLLKGWQWAALGVLVGLAWVVYLIIALIAALVLGLWLRRRRIDLDRAARRHVARSLGAAVAVLFGYYAIRFLDLPDPPLGALLRGLQLVLGVTAVWVCYRSVDIIGGHIAADKDVRLTRFDDVLIPLLSKILRILVVLVGVLAVVDWMGWEIKTVLGALGIGGVALAFAAQDTIGNFFGSITVLFDRPFGIGDWIVIGDVEGTVERVGFRSTRVRTFYNSVVTMPNSKMVNTQVDNYGARQFRRTRVMLSVTYSTPPERIDAFCEGIRELVRLHPYTRKDYYHIYFNQFAASSLDILVYIFFEVPDWGTELRERHRLFIDIMKLADRLGVEFAFPTQTIWMAKDEAGATATEPVSIVAGKDDPDQIGVTEAARLFEASYGPGPKRPGPVIIDREPRSKGPV